MNMPDGGAPTGPLTGVVVLDFSRVLTGPHCGRMLVDLGADVVKVEPPDGDIIRFASPRVNSMSTYFVQQNCGKRNLSIDLTRPGAADVVLRMAARADVLLENFRPGVMDRLGIGYERLSQVNDRLVYATITGYGQAGPWASRGAYAATIHAELGMMDVLGRVRGTPPAHDPHSHADLYAALECVSGIVAALFHRERTGRGQRVDVSMAQTMLCVNEHAHAEIRGDMRSAFGSALTRSPVLRTRDGRFVTISADITLRGAFGQLCTAMGRRDLADDPRFATDEDRRAHRDDLLDVVQRWVESHERTEDLEAALDKGRLAMGVVRTAQEAAESEWGQATSAVAFVPVGEETVGIPNSPWTFSASPAGVRGRPAFRGEHNREVLAELAGLTADEIAALESSGVVSSRPPSGSS